MIKLRKKLQVYFFAGLLTIAPIGLTFLTLNWALGLLNRMFNYVFPKAVNPDQYIHDLFGFHIPGLNIIFLVIVVIIIGGFARSLAGKWIVSLWDTILDHTPIVKSIYNTVKQVTSTILSQDGNSFKEAVLVEFPKENSWTIGFVTKAPSQLAETIGNPLMINVFVPTTPNPTSGFLMIVDRNKVFPMPCTVEQALKMLISGGVISPDQFTSQEEKTKN